MGKNGVLENLVSAPEGKEIWLDLPPPVEVARRRERTLVGCAVDGCRGVRKYRCVGDFEVGGCSMEHLRVLDARVRDGVS